MADEVRDLLDEYSTLKSERKPFEETWQEIVDNVAPSRSGFLVDDPGKGERRGAGIKDGTPMWALETYKAGLMGRLLSSYFDWFSIRVPDEDLMDVPDIRRWLSKVDQALYSLIARSNFYPQMYQFFGDGGSIGTATIYRYWNENTKREVFSVQHPRQIYLAENEDGDNDTIFNVMMMTNKKLVQAFGQDNLHGDIVKAAAQPQEMYVERKVIHVVKPNEKYDPRKKESKAKRFASWYIDVEHESIIRQAGYSNMPYASWRVEKEPDEVYGRGPGWRALHDIKSLYAYADTDIRAAQYAVNPAVDIPMERKGMVKLIPGARNYYEESNRPIMPIQTQLNLGAGLDREQRKQQIIERHFMVPFFTMMQQVGEQTRNRTAYEIRRIEEETAVLLGPHITGLNQDVMDKLIDGLFNDAWEAGLIPQPPDILLKGERRLEVDYMGPLALAQRSYFHSEPFRKTIGDLSGIAAMDPTGQTLQRALQNYDWDRVTREMSRANGLPEENMMDEKVRDQIRQAIAQEQQKQQQLAAMEQLGKAVPGLSKAPEAGSPAESMNAAG